MSIATLTPAEESVAAGAIAPDRFDPASPRLRIDPYPIYHYYRETDPIHWGVSGLAGYAGAWYLFRHADAISTLKDPRLGKARRQVSYGQGGTEGQREAPPPVPEAARPFFELARNWIVHRDPPDHTRLRTLLRPYFTPPAAERMRARITEITHELIDEMEGRGGEVDLIRDFAFPLPVNVIGELLGVPPEGRPILSACSKALQAVDLRTSEETFRRAGEAVATARDYVGRLIAERRRQPREDLISELVRAFDGGAELSEEELLANVFFLFVAGAGFETTTGLIGSGIHALLTHPEERAKLLADPSLVEGAVDEALRYEPPVQVTNRNALQDLEIGGRQIRTGESVLVVLAAANRDPAVFPDPDRFNITREGKPNHAFGVGIHFCLGGPLARVEGEVAFDALFRRLPGLQASGPAVWNPAVSLRVLQSLPATF